MRCQVWRLLCRCRSAGLIVTAVMLLSGLLWAVQLHTVGSSVSAENVVAVTPQAPSGAVSRSSGPVSADLVAHTAHEGRMVALTFDDGPHPTYTPQLLALLARYHAVATFCMIGSQATQHPDLVRTVAAAGMLLCDHTVNHDQHLRDRPESQIEAEIVGGRTALLDAVGADSPVDYFRAPGGRWSDQIRQIAASNGMKPLAWSVDPRDWSRPGTEQIVAAVQQQTRPGAVILLHDGGGRRDQTIAALQELLPWFVEQGYQFDVPA